MNIEDMLNTQIKTRTPILLVGKNTLGLRKDKPAFLLAEWGFWGHPGKDDGYVPLEVKDRKTGKVILDASLRNVIKFRKPVTVSEMVFPHIMQFPRIANHFFFEQVFIGYQDIVDYLKTQPGLEPYLSIVERYAPSSP